MKEITIKLKIQSIDDEETMELYDMELEDMIFDCIERLNDPLFDYNYEICDYKIKTRRILK